MKISEIFKVLHIDLLEIIGFKYEYKDQYFIDMWDFLLCCYVDKIMQIGFPIEYTYLLGILTNNVNNYQFFIVND